MMHWHKNAHLLYQFHMKHDLSTATNTAWTKYWFCALFMYQYFLLAFELVWQKKPYLAKTLTEPIDRIVLLSAPNPNFACNNQSSRGFGALLKGLTCRSRDSNPQPRITSPTLYPLEPRLPTCRGSTCAHWCPSSWWRSRRPPSLPMPRNGTAYAFESLSRFYGVIQWSSAQHRFEWTNKHVLASLWSFYINPTFSRIMNWIMYMLLVKLLWMI